MTLYEFYLTQIKINNFLEDTDIEIVIANNDFNIENLSKPSDIVIIPKSSYNSPHLNTFVQAIMGAHTYLVVENKQIIEAPGFNQNLVIERENYLSTDSSEIIILLTANLSADQEAELLVNAANYVGLSYDYLFLK